MRYVAEEIAITYWDLYGLLEKGLKKRTPRFYHECPREWAMHYQKKKEKEQFGERRKKRWSIQFHTCFL